MSKAPTPEAFAASGSEYANQVALMMWAASSKIPELKWLVAIPNGEYRNKATAGKLKAMGVRAGIPDLFLAIRRGRYPGLWIELKKLKSGKTSPEQDIWLEHLKSQGYGARVCYGWESAKDTILEYLKYEE